MLKHSPGWVWVWGPVVDTSPLLLNGGKVLIDSGCYPCLPLCLTCFSMASLIAFLRILFKSFFSIWDNYNIRGRKTQNWLNLRFCSLLCYLTAVRAWSWYSTGGFVPMVLPANHISRLWTMSQTTAELVVEHLYLNRFWSNWATISQRNVSNVQTYSSQFLTKKENTASLRQCTLTQVFYSFWLNRPHYNLSGTS